MKTFEDFIEKMPVVLKNRFLALTDVAQREDYHPEGSVFNHTRVVFNRLNKWTNGEINMLMVALFHDIGKDKTSKINPKNGKLQAIGHERVSGQVVREFYKWIRDMGADPFWVEDMVLNHMRVGSFDRMRPFKQEAMRNMDIFDDLVLFNKADKMQKPTEDDWKQWMY
jgi:tRNA nucleotidyltransferase (CCA-adding enzyme)